MLLRLRNDVKNEDVHWAFVIRFTHWRKTLSTIKDLINQLIFKN